MSATSPTERPMYSPADLREVEVWLQQFRADGRCDPKQAAATLAERLRATRTAPDLWERVTRTLLAEKDFDGAEVLLRSGLDAYPQRHALRTLLGNTLRLQARYAERELRGVLADDPQNELASRSLLSEHSLPAIRVFRQQYEHKSRRAARTFVDHVNWRKRTPTCQPVGDSCTLRYVTGAV